MAARLGFFEVLYSFGDAKPVVDALATNAREFGTLGPVLSVARKSAIDKPIDEFFVGVIGARTPRREERVAYIVTEI